MTQAPATHETHPAVLPPGLFRHWVHSREEDSGGLDVYRPDGFAFPPSFGRDGFQMDPNGRFVQDDVGPADGIVQTTGRWRQDGARRIVVTFDTAEREGFAFRIVALDGDTLRIRREPAAGGQPGQNGGHPGPAYAEAPAMDEAQLDAYASLPPAQSCRRIDFDRAQVLALRTFPPQFVLVVSGTKPYQNMDVELVPLVFIQQPEYWGIEVVGCLRGIGLPAETPYRVSLRLTGFIGKKGIEVLGATRSEQIDVPPAQEPQPQPQAGDCTFEAFLDRQPPGPATLRVLGSCEFPTAGFEVELRRGVPQGINPRDLILDKVVTAPDGPVAQVVTRVEVRYEEPAGAGFDTVTIRPDGGTIRVQEVS